MPSQGRTTPRLDRMVSVRLTAAEEADIREEARRRGMSVSNFMRMAAVREARPAATVAAEQSVTVAASYVPQFVGQASQSAGTHATTGVFSTT